MEFEEKSKVYIQTDAEGRILRCDSGYTTPADLTGWIEIDEGTGDKYNLCQSHYFDGGLYTMDGIHRYRWDGPPSSGGLTARQKVGILKYQLRRCIHEAAD